MNIEKLTVKEVIKSDAKREANAIVVIREDGTDLTLTSSKAPIEKVAVGDILVVNADTLTGDQQLGVVATINSQDIKTSNKATKPKTATMAGRSKGSNSNKATLSMRD